MKKIISCIVGLALLASTSAYAASPKAKYIRITDTGDYYTGTEVETALQELGAGTTMESLYLKIDGSNANTTIDIGSQAITTTGTGTFGAISFASAPINITNNGTDYGPVQIGFGAVADGQGSVALGYNAYSGGIFSLSIGNGSSANANDSVAIGFGATATNVGQVVFASSLGTLLDIDGGTADFQGLDITTTGSITGGSLNVDDVILNGNILSISGLGSSIDIGSRYLYDFSSAKSMDYSSRYLYASNGTDKILDFSTAGTAEFGDSIIQTSGSIYVDSDSSVLGLGLASPSAPDATIGFTGSDLKLSSNAITATDGLILQQKAVCVSTDGTIPTDNYQFKIKMDADTPRGLFIDGATNDYTGAVGSYGIYVDREYNWGTGAIGYMKGMYFDIEHKSSNAKISAFTQNNAMQLRISNAGTTNNNTATNVSYYDDLMTNEFYGSTQVVDTSSTGKITYYQRGNLINFVHAPTLTDTGGNSPASIMYRYGQQIAMTSSPTILSGAWVVDDYGLVISMSTSAINIRNKYGISFYNFGGGSGSNYAIYTTGTGADALIYDNATGTDSIIIDVDNKKISMGETNSDFQLYSDGTNACIDFTGGLKINGVAGFTGTGAYTNFTIVDGIITGAS